MDGLLSGLSQGLREGFDSFRENDRYEKERADRRKNDALAKALQLRQLKDSGFDYDETTGALTQTEQGTQDKEASRLKKQLDVYTEAYKALPEDRRGGTREGQELFKNISGLTKKLTSLYGGADDVTPEVSAAASESVAKPTAKRGLVQTGGIFGGAKKEAPVGLLKDTEDAIPGLRKTSQGFLPGQLSKEDRQFNDALKKKAADINIEETIGAPKQNQALAAGYALRMTDAEKAMQDLIDSGYDRTDISQQRQAIFTDPGLDRVPWVGDAANGLISGAARLSGQVDPKLYQQRQAEQNFVNALLRRESGSAISASEFNKAEEQYFPRYGDSKETLEQKAQNRLTALSALKSEAGKAFDKAKSVRDTELANRKKTKGLISK